MSSTLVFSFFFLPAALAQTNTSTDLETISSPETGIYNSQTLDILSPNSHPSFKGPTGGEDDITVENGALVADGNPSADKDAEKIFQASTEGISVYIVHSGDTLSQIADMFGVKVSTIRGFNNIRKDSDLKPGMELLILPIDGISYKVVSGDTLASVAKKFTKTSTDATMLASDISLFNDIGDDGKLTIGSEIIIPNAESETAQTPAKGGKGASAPHTGGKGYFVKAWSGPITQGFHDTYRAKDYGMPIGSKVGASAAGKVIAAREGWNGGYGTVVIIQHPNGAQTLYAHLSKILVSTGQAVAQRETIGLSGSTGRSTGPHLHFEIRHWGDIPF